MRHTTALAACFVILLFALSARSQPVGQIDKHAEVQRLRLQAVSMIRQVATEAPLWNDHEAAVQALADAADVLWDDEPGQSAKWLRKAWDLTSQLSSAPKDEQLKAYFTNSVQAQLRTRVLTVARRRDPKLAEQFLKEMSQQESDEKRERGAFDDRTARSEQLLSMAQEILEADPAEAFSLAEASLSDGLSYKLQNVLTSLRKKDVELANQLFDLAVARFSRSLPDPSEAQILAGYLFRPGLTFSRNGNGQNLLVLNPAQQNVAIVATSEPQRTKSFLIAVYERLLSQPVSIETPAGKQRAQQILLLGNLIGRRYAGFAPELAPSAQGFLAQLQRQLLPEGESVATAASARTTSNSTDTTKRLTTEELYAQNIAELEESADKEGNAAFRRVAYAKTALATKPSDYLRGKRIAGKIDDDDLRADVVSFVLYRAALAFVEKAEVEKAVEIAPTISDVSRRAVVKIAVAQRLLAADAKEEPASVNLARQRAVELLSDIDRDLKKGEPSANAAKILLGRTAILAKLDRDQALASLAQAVEMINKLDRFDLRDGGAPNLGLSSFSASGATIASPRVGFDLRSTTEPLVEANFEQVTGVVERLTTKEVNGSGRLEIAKLYLQQTKDSLSSRKVLSETAKSR